MFLQDQALQKKRCLETLLYVNEVENLLQVNKWLIFVDIQSNLFLCDLPTEHWNTVGYIKTCGNYLQVILIWNALRRESHNTSYCLIEVVTKARLAVYKIMVALRVETLSLAWQQVLLNHLIENNQTYTYV